MILDGSCFFHQLVSTASRQERLKMNISLYARDRNHILVEMITKNNLWKPGLRHPDKNRRARIRIPGTEIDVLVVELTKGYAMIVDDIPEVEELLKESTYYAVVGKWDVRPRSKAGYFYRHLMQRLHGEIPEDQEVDHIDICPLNNTRANLRLISSSGNKRNRGRHKNNSSGHKGISWCNRHQRWIVYCIVNGQRKNRLINPRTLGISKEAALELAIQARRELEEDMGYHDF